MLFHSFCGSRMTWRLSWEGLAQGLTYSSSWDVDGDAVIQRREQGWRIHFWDCLLPRGQPAGSLTYPSHGPRHCLPVGSLHHGSWLPQEQVIWKRARRKSHYFMNTPCKTKAVTWAFWKWGVLKNLVNMFLNHCCFTGGYPSGSVVKSLPAKAGDAGDVSWIPGSGRSVGGGNGNLLQHSCLENSMESGAWQATVHGVTKSWTWLSTHATISLTKTDYLAESNYSGIQEINLSLRMIPIFPLNKTGALASGRNWKGILGRQLAHEFAYNGVLEIWTK